jgi:hypothetical protein
MLLWLNGQSLVGEGVPSVADAVAELHDRVRRLQRLSGAHASVSVSRDVAGLRAVSVPDRNGGCP